MALELNFNTCSLRSSIVLFGNVFLDDFDILKILLLNLCIYIEHVLAAG